MAKEGKERVEEIELLEMDELFTFVKKSPKEGTRRAGNAAIPEFGLLWIGTDLKILRL